MTPSELHEVFVRRVRELAARAKLDLSELAGKAGIDPVRFQAYLDGHESPEIDDVAALASALEVNASTLLKDG